VDDSAKRAKKMIDAEIREKELKKSDPADKGDVSVIRSDIKKKQDQMIYNLNKRVMDLTTEVAALRQNQKEREAGITQWASRTNGMIDFCYAICKKADTFMKERSATGDPFRVGSGNRFGTGGAPALNPDITGVPDPFSVDIKSGKTIA